MRWTRGALLLAYLVVAIRYAHRMSFISAGERVFTLWDDAMISMRYARNLAQGDGLVWNVGERVQGFSNLGLTLVMAVVHLVPVPLRLVPFLFQLCSAAALASVVFLTARVTSQMTSSPAAGLAAGLVSFAFAPLGIWGMQGSDAAAIAVVLILATNYALPALESPRARARTPRLAVFVVLAAGVLVRLDFALTYVLFFAVLLRESRERRVTLVRGLVPLVVTVGAILLFGALYYGDPLPNTYYLKATGIPLRALLTSGWLNLTDAAFGAARGRFVVVLGLSVVYAALSARVSAMARLLAATVVLHWAYFVWIGGDWMMLHISRFLVPVMPLAVVLVIGGLTTTLRRALRRTSLDLARRRAALSGALALHVLVLVVCMNPRESIDEWWTASAPPFLHEENRRSYEDARYLARFSDPSTMIAVFWAGVLPYYCDRPMLDLLGRADRHIAHGTMVPAALYWPGHAKRDWDYVLDERKPDILLSTPEEMSSRTDFLNDYCLPGVGGIWIALRRHTAWKWKSRFIAPDCTE
jgi:hypothetical protein